MRIRYPRKRIVSTLVWHHASRSRTTRSSMQPDSRARSMIRSSSARKKIGFVAASSPRSWPSRLFATFQPPLTGPTTFSAGMRASVKNTSQNSASPVRVVIGLTSTPGVSIWHNRKVMPRCFGTVGSVRAKRKMPVPSIPRDVQVFCPLITHSCPSSSARSRMLARSEPDSGSEYPCTHTSSPEMILGIYRRFCSSVPQLTSVLPSILTVVVSDTRPSGTRALAISWASTTWSSLERPPPPYSTGQVMPIRPCSQSVRRQLIENASASSRSSVPSPCQPGGKLAARNSRTWARKASASGGKERSIVGQRLALVQSDPICGTTPVVWSRIPISCSRLRQSPNRRSSM